MLRGVAVVYIIDGRQVGNLEDFWRVMGEAVNGPGGYFGSGSALEMADQRARRFKALS